jgi:hypothetical protein
MALKLQEAEDFKVAIIKYAEKKGLSFKEAQLRINELPAGQL